LRVTFLTHYFPPEVGAPQARIGALARALADRGAEVTVHTCPPHYPHGRILPPYRNRLRQVERDGPVRIVRSAVYPAANRGIARRLANHLSLAGSALATAPTAGAADVIVAETPPLFTAAAAIPYARLKRAALVVNVADRWPASAVELGALGDPRAIRAAEWLEGRLYAAADAITAPTAGLTSGLDEHPDARGKTVHVPQGVDLRLFPATPLPEAGPLRVLYAGTVGLAHRMQTLVEAAELAGPDVVHVTIAGGGADLPEVERLVRERSVSNVEVLGVVPHEAVPGLYAACDVAAVLLRDTPVLHRALPTKLLEAMASGRGVLLSAHGEAAEFIRSAEAGVVVAPEDPEALAEAMRALHADRARLVGLGAGARAHAERFSRDRLTAQWWDLLSDLAGRRGGASAATAPAPAPGTPAATAGAPVAGRR
jgi:glycosyltransferase involved in cell wall biosynthesis